MIQVFERSFAEKLKAGDGSAKLKEVIPSYGQSLAESAARCANQSMKNCSFC
jgi:hypothetical protein